MTICSSLPPYLTAMLLQYVQILESHLVALCLLLRDVLGFFSFNTDFQSDLLSSTCAGRLPSSISLYLHLFWPFFWYTSVLTLSLSLLALSTICVVQPSYTLTCFGSFNISLILKHLCLVFNLLLFQYKCCVYFHFSNVCFLFQQLQFCW